MRIRTAGNYAHRLDVIEAAVDALDGNTKTAAVLAACEHALRDRRAKEEALEHPGMTPELAEVLSTSQLKSSYDITVEINTE